MITRENIKDLIVKLKLPQIIMDIYEKKPLPKEIKYDFGFPENYFYLSEKEQYAIGENKFYPLWDDGNFDTLVGYEIERKLFIRFYPEEEVKISEIRGLTWQQILVKEFLNFYEYNIEEDVIVNLAKTFDFKYINHFLNEIKKADLSTFENTQEWEGQFVSSIAE